MHKNLGDLLLRYTSGTKNTLFLVAPFIKFDVISKICEVLSSEVNFTVITRWIPQEISVGVSDINIWKIVNDRPNSKLALCQNLHAKYYRFDDLCLVGSANLTKQALGWKNLSNLELLLPYSFIDDSLVEFESELISQSFIVNEEIYLEYNILVEKINQEISPKALYETNLFQPTFLWLPSLRNPEDLYYAYLSQWDRLTTLGKEISQKELDNFAIPQGLSCETFKMYIGLFIRHTKILKTVDSYLDKPRRFGEMQNLVSNFLSDENLDFDPVYTWQTLMRWLLYFLPLRYSCKVFKYSEIFYLINDK